MDRLVVRIQTLASVSAAADEPDGSSPVDPTVDMVRRVFRGDIVEDQS